VAGDLSPSLRSKRSTEQLSQNSEGDLKKVKVGNDAEATLEQGGAFDRDLMASNDDRNTAGDL
jgi:hypothetical protein